MQTRSQQALTAVRRILRATEMNARNMSRASGMTATQLLVLHILRDRAEATAGDVAARLGITQATTTNLLHKLVDRGLIERRRGDTDRRQVWLRLTETGRAALGSAPDALQALFVGRFEQLPDWEQAMLVAALERVVALLNAERIDAAPVLAAGAVVQSEELDGEG